MHVYSQLHALLSYLYHKVFNEGMQVIRNSKETVFPSHSNFQLQIKKYQLRINLKLIKLLSESLKWKKLLYFHNNSIQFCLFSQVKRDLKERMFNLEKWHFKKCQNRVLQQLKIFFFFCLHFYLKKELVWNWPIYSFSFRKVVLYKEKASASYLTTESFLANAFV